MEVLIRLFPSSNMYIIQIVRTTYEKYLTRRFIKHQQPRKQREKKNDYTKIRFENKVELV